MSSYKCVIWGLGIDYEQYINAVKYQERLGNIEIVGVTSNLSIYEQVDGFKYIPKEALADMDFDLLIVGSTGNFQAIRQDAILTGIDDRKIVNIKIFALPELDLNKYLAIKNSDLSIFASTCWGGVTYDRLGMAFLSPFINMRVFERDFLKMMSAPKHYLSCEPTLDRYLYEQTLKWDYPVCRIDDVELHFNHYSNLEHAITKWNIRKARINWDNIFVMMFTTEFDEASRFIDLPFTKKICFVPFETSEPSLLSVPYSKMNGMDKVPFWMIANGMSTGTYKSYDVLDLLLGDNNRKRI